MNSPGTEPTRKRATRSCTNCRNLKTRCLGWQSPPCQRCIALSLESECKFSKPSRSTSGGISYANRRIKALEQQIESLTKSLGENRDSPQSRPLQQGSSEPVEGRSLMHDDADIAALPSANIPGPTTNSDRYQTNNIISPTSSSPKGTHTYFSKSMSAVPIDKSAAPQSTYLTPFEMLAHATSDNKFPETSNPQSFLPAAHYEPVNYSKFPHAVSKGFISADKALKLINRYFEKCHLFSPILDKDYGRFDELSNISPFLINAILTVVLRLEAEEPYKTIEAIAHESYSICTSTLLCTSYSIDCVESVCILSTWSTPNYLLAGHALRLGLDMRLDHAFARLEDIASTGGRDKPIQLDEKEERNLVRAARLWLQLVNLDLQVSITGNRPIMLGENERITGTKCSLLTFNVYAIPSDIKLASNICLTAIKFRISETVIMLRGFLALNYGRRTATRLDQWHEEWDSSLSQHYPEDSFVRKSLLKELHFCRIFLFSSCLRSAGMADLDYNRRDALELVFMTQQSALIIMQLCISKNAFSEVLKYATPSIHLEIAFSSILLLKLSGFFPDTDSDFAKGLREKTEKLINILSGCVGAQRYLKYISDALNEYITITGNSEHYQGHSEESQIDVSHSEPVNDYMMDPLSGLGLGIDQDHIQGWDSAEFTSLFSTIPNDVQALFSTSGPLLASDSVYGPRNSPVGGLETIFAPGWANELGGMS